MVIFKLNELLTTKGKSKYWLAKQTGIDSNSISKICNNTSSQIKLITIDKICSALNCEIFDLLEYKKN